MRKFYAVVFTRISYSQSCSDAGADTVASRLAHTKTVGLRWTLLCALNASGSAMASANRFRDYSSMIGISHLIQAHSSVCLCKDFSG